MYVVFEANAPVECRRESVVAILPTRLREDHRRVVSGSGASRSKAHRDLEDGDTVAVVVGTTATALLVEALAESDALCFPGFDVNCVPAERIVRARSWQEASAIAARCGHCVVVAETRLIHPEAHLVDARAGAVPVIAAETVLDASCHEVRDASRLRRRSHGKPLRRRSHWLMPWTFLRERVLATRASGQGTRVPA